ncbi:MAG: methyltransferase [Nannocystaceae bacterium]
MTEGLRADDAGVLLLSRALATVDPRGVLVVHAGELPGLRGPATRIVLDVRELAGARDRCIRADDDAALAALADFTDAAVWPRAHLGKDFSFACLALGARALRPGGALWCCARKHKGAESLADAMVALLGNVETVDRDQGYRLMKSVFEDQRDLGLARTWIELRHAFADPWLGPEPMHAAPGVFSRRELDRGTRVLIEHVAAWADRVAAAPALVLDLCAGIGPLARFASVRWPQARLLAIESNLVAAALLRDNLAAARERLVLWVRDGLPTPAQAPREGDPIAPASVSLALVNPPTHAERGALVALLRGLRPWMAPGGDAFVVVSRAGVSSAGLHEAGAHIDATTIAGYTILHARWP